MVTVTFNEDYATLDDGSLTENIGYSNALVPEQLVPIISILARAVAAGCRSWEDFKNHPNRAGIVSGGG